ncbi:hypothetical protein AABB24_015220 [Solanum stoloniferum]|uniref:Uncharacterized protein n=2 Tax=Solanum TaxID=4107 RepID=A0AAF0UE50_SOLVR|nr:uncharacterized protein LOC125840467 [Solanum verrucosum]WMV44307.1 hypothetical protein MTR67_037692 [Solanum verrucosum]
MEGLIPFVYKAIMDYKNGGQIATGSPRWMNNDSPLLGSYMRLPGGSGRFENSSDIQLFGSPDNEFSMNSSSASSSSVAAGKRSMVSGGSPTARCHWISTRAVNR